MYPQMENYKCVTRHCIYNGWIFIFDHVLALFLAEIRLYHDPFITPVCNLLSELISVVFILLAR